MTLNLFIKMSTVNGFLDFHFVFVDRLEVFC